MRMEFLLKPTQWHGHRAPCDNGGTMTSYGMMQVPVPLPDPVPSPDELPEYVGPPMESYKHYLNLLLLFVTLRLYFEELRDVFVGVNLAVYYSQEQVTNRDFLSPDLFVVLDAESRQRRSWVPWHEGGRGLNVVIEMLSDSTAVRDRGEKRDLYEHRLRVPELFLYDPRSARVEGLRLSGGHYHPIRPHNGRWTSEELDLTLVIWQGTFQGAEGAWLRWALPDGTLLPTPNEVAAKEREAAAAAESKAQAEHQAAEAAQQRADALAEALARYRERFGELS